MPGLHAAYTDVKRRVICDTVTLLIFLAGFIYAIINGTYISAFFGYGVGFFCFFIVAWITNGALGGGDIKLVAGIGMWFGSDVILIIVLASLGSIIFELFRYWCSGKLHELFYDRLQPYTRKVLLRFGCRVKNVDLSIDPKYSSLPFGPFLVGCTWLVWTFQLSI